MCVVLYSCFSVAWSTVGAVQTFTIPCVLSCFSVAWSTVGAVQTFTIIPCVLSCFRGHGALCEQFRPSLLFPVFVSVWHGALWKQFRLSLLFPVFCLVSVWHEALWEQFQTLTIIPCVLSCFSVAWSTVGSSSDCHYYSLCFVLFQCGMKHCGSSSDSHYYSLCFVISVWHGALWEAVQTLTIIPCVLSCFSVA